MRLRLPKSDPWLFVVNVVGVTISLALIPAFLLFAPHKPLTLANMAPMLWPAGLLALSVVIRQVRRLGWRRS
jgi:hypothetical protein